MDSSRFDYTFEETEQLEALKRVILSNYETRGFRQIHLSAFETTKTFVEQQGETVLQKIFTLNGESESDEFCLRPELTVPAFKFYQNTLSEKTEYCRLCYEGLVWRMDPIAQGFYSEFTQAGVELIGNYCEIGADTEILELAIDTLRKCKVNISNIVVNDVRILKCVFRELKLGTKLQSLLEQMLIRKQGISSLPVREENPINGNKAFEDVLKLVGSEKLSDFLVEIFSLQGYAHEANSRTPEEVADRFIRTKTGDQNTFSGDQFEILSELLSISGEVADVAVRLKKFATKHGFSELEKYIDTLQLKTNLLESASSGEALPEIRWDLSFQRSFKYYSGLIFDINTKNGAVCGGGRYDDLFSQIGSRENRVKAAGFAIGIDRLLNEPQNLVPSGHGKPTAIVAPLGDSAIEQCFVIARVARESNWIAETDFSGANIQNIIRKAVRGNADILLLVGEDEVQNGTVTVKRLSMKTQKTISVSDLADFLKTFRNSDGAS